MSNVATWSGEDRAAPSEWPIQTLRNVALVLGLFLACWAVLYRFWGQWLAPDYPTTGLWSMLAAVGTWASLVYGDRVHTRTPSRSLLQACALCLLCYAASYGPLPRLVSSFFAMSALAFGLLGTLTPARRRQSAGLLLWMWASLPLGIAFNTYFGYPLRIIVGHGASWVLGGTIEPLGAGLTDGTHTVFIDAPCSGVRMLRIAVLLVGVVSVLTQLRCGATFALACLGIVLAFVGNTARVSMLFVLSRQGDVSDGLHSGIGVAGFGGTAVLLVMAALWLQRRAKVGPAGSDSVKVGPWTYSMLLVAGLLAATIPLSAREQRHVGVGEAVWPIRVDGERWRETPPDAAMERFRASYLGDWSRGVLEESGRNILLRQCGEPTLTLHTTEECYRAFGYHCSNLSAWKDPQGHLWSRFRAVHPDGRVFTVRQCFFSVDPVVIAQGGDLSDWTDGVRSWPDAASWYWAAARPASGVTRTLAVAIAEVE